MLVHFPIALLLAGFLAEVAFVIFKKEAFTVAGFWLLILGTLSALAAFLTGKLFTGEMSGAAGEIQETHEFFATTTLIIALMAAAFRVYLRYSGREKSGLKWVAFGTYAATAAAVGITGFFGGILVYNYMMPL